MAKKITVMQSSNSFTVALVREQGSVVLVVISDQDGPAGVRWWLNAAMYDLRETLSVLGCQKSQLDEIVEKLAANREVHIVVDLPA
jgi:hypothetical protein